MINTLYQLRKVSQHSVEKLSTTTEFEKNFIHLNLIRIPGEYLSFKNYQNMS